MFFKILKNEYINHYGNKSLLILRVLKWYMTAPNYRVVVLIKYCTKVKSNFLKRMVRNKLSIKYNTEIGTNPKIGENFSIEHFQSIVIGNNVEIGNNVKLYQNVTLGQKNGEYPSIKDNVIINAGAKVIGNIVIGENSIVGANAVVVRDVPANVVVAGVPAKVIKQL